MSAAGQEIEADAPDGAELTRFQLELLYELRNSTGCSDYGLGIKRSMEAYYGGDVNHGRLYPNLDDLVEMGFVEKSELDKRTNKYELTTSGMELVAEDAAHRNERAGGEDGDA